MIFVLHQYSVNNHGIAFALLSKHMRATCRVLAIGVLLLLARPLAASPITYNFVGQWNFHDPQVDTPDFWAAMNNVGVYNGTAFTWAMTLDSAVPGEVTSDFKINNLEYTFSANTTSPDPTQGFFWAGSMNGSTVQGPQLTYRSAISPVLERLLPPRPSKRRHGVVRFCVQFGAGVITGLPSFRTTRKSCCAR